jgi:hypothetical protein
MSNTNWTDRTIYGIPMGKTIDVPLTVTGGASPGAALIALNAGRAIAAYQHLSELAELDKGTLYELLNDVRKLAAAAETIEEELIVRHREAGASWAELAAALDIDSRQVAKERYLRIKRANERGLNTRGLAAEEGPSATGGSVVNVVGGTAVVGRQIGSQSRTIVTRAEADGITIGEAQDRIDAERAAVCDCQCDHGAGGICLSCGCRCEPTEADVCPCCGADDQALTRAADLGQQIDTLTERINKATGPAVAEYQQEISDPRNERTTDHDDD